MWWAVMLAACSSSGKAPASDAPPSGGEAGNPDPLPVIDGDAGVCTVDWCMGYSGIVIDGTCYTQCSGIWPECADGYVATRMQCNRSADDICLCIQQ